MVLAQQCSVNRKWFNKYYELTFAAAVLEHRKPGNYYIVNEHPPSVRVRRKHRTSTGKKQLQPKRRSEESLFSEFQFKKSEKLYHSRSFMLQYKSLLGDTTPD